VAAAAGQPTIRPATAGDAVKLAALAQRTWADAFGWSVDAPDVDEELRRNRSAEYFLGALGASTILVAETGGRLLGYAQFGRCEIPEVATKPGAELHRVYVDREFQNRGLGTQLVTAALAHPGIAAAPRVYLQVWEDNAGAVRLYQRFGFRTVGRTRFTIGAGQVLEDLVMVLEREHPTA